MSLAIDVKIVSLDTATADAAGAEGKYQLALVGHGFGSADPISQELQRMVARNVLSLSLYGPTGSWSSIGVSSTAGTSPPVTCR